MARLSSQAAAMLPVEKLGRTRGGSEWGGPSLFLLPTMPRPGARGPAPSAAPFMRAASPGLAAGGADAVAKQLKTASEEVARGKMLTLAAVGFEPTPPKRLEP